VIGTARFVTASGLSEQMSSERFTESVFAGSITPYGKEEESRSTTRDFVGNPREAPPLLNRGRERGGHDVVERYVPANSQEFIFRRPEQGLVSGFAIAPAAMVSGVVSPLGTICLWTHMRSMPMPPRADVALDKKFSESFRRERTTGVHYSLEGEKRFLGYPQKVFGIHRSCPAISGCRDANEEDA
jgi:hypothetical protein